MNSAAPPLPRLNEGLATLSAGKDLILCDVWGVIHNGVCRFDAAVDALRRFRQSGGTVVLVTNAPVPAAQVRSRLESLRVSRDAYDEIATAGDVAIDLIVAADRPAIFTIGPEDETAIVQEAARRSARSAHVVDLANASLALCIGLDDTGDLPAHYDGILARLLERNLQLICANPDIVVEVGNELVFCAGAIAERYVSLGGTVIQTGKPYSAIYERAIAMAAAIRGATHRTRMLAIGDAIATDIAGAANQGIPSVFVTSGIHRAQLHRPEGDPTVDPIALARFLDSGAAMPNAAVPHLFW